MKENVKKGKNAKNQEAAQKSSNGPSPMEVPAVQAPIQMKKSASPLEGAENPSNPLSSGGMPSRLMQKMETSFGQDFSGVKLNTNSSRATSLGALAFAQGDEVHFAPGQFNPHSLQGQQLIGHELGHVTQQQRGKSIGKSAFGAGEYQRLEQNTQVGAAPFGSVQMQPDPDRKPNEDFMQNISAGVGLDQPNKDYDVYLVQSCFYWQGFMYEEEVTGQISVKTLNLIKMASGGNAISPNSSAWYRLVSDATSAHAFRGQWTRMTNKRPVQTQKQVNPAINYAPIQKPKSVDYGIDPNKQPKHYFNSISKEKMIMLENQRKEEERQARHMAHLKSMGPLMYGTNGMNGLGQSMSVGVRVAPHVAIAFSTGGTGTLATILRTGSVAFTINATEQFTGNLLYEMGQKGDGTPVWRAFTKIDWFDASIEVIPLQKVGLAGKYMVKVVLASSVDASIDAQEMIGFNKSKTDFAIDMGMNTITFFVGETGEYLGSYGHYAKFDQMDNITQGVCKMFEAMLKHPTNVGGTYGGNMMKDLFKEP